MHFKPLIAFFAGLTFVVAVSSPSIAAKVKIKHKNSSGPRPFMINARSALLVDMTDGKLLYEQNPDVLIAPASITKVLTLYVIFDAIREGRLRLWETAEVSCRAAGTGGSRMGLHAGDVVTIEELIKGAAVVSGNDACVALAEHMYGDVNEFVRHMNLKARTLGMRNSVFLTPNGLPAKGQVTTAGDIARLSMSYLMRFPESLSIHSMTSYTYRTTTHRNANRLLGTCPGVDGLKTGFVCAAGYNLAATAKRGDVRLLAVVLGAPSAGVRAAETKKLLEYGFQKLGQTPSVEVLEVRREPAVGGMKLAEDEDRACPVVPGKASVKASRGGRKAASSAAGAVSKMAVRQKSTAKNVVTVKADNGATVAKVRSKPISASKASSKVSKKTDVKVKTVTKTPSVVAKQSSSAKMKQTPASGDSAKPPVTAKRPETVAPSAPPVTKKSHSAAGASQRGKVGAVGTKTPPTTGQAKQAASNSSSNSKKSSVDAKSASPATSTSLAREKKG